MLTYFVHEATLELAPGADERAGGAAVTVALCGDWEHEGPCRWPHHTSIGHRSGPTIGIRTVFVCEMGEESEVRDRIRRALATGELAAPDESAVPSRWRLLGERPGDLRPDETELARRLARTR